MSNLFKVATVDELKHGSSKIVEVDGNDIAVFNIDGVFFAISNICPHRGGSLADGSVENGIVTCPLHGWQFNLKDGSNALMPGPNVSCYKVKVEDGDVFVEVD